MNVCQLGKVQCIGKVQNQLCHPQVCQGWQSLFLIVTTCKKVNFATHSTLYAHACARIKAKNSPRRGRKENTHGNLLPHLPLLWGKPGSGRNLRLSGYRPDRKLTYRKSVHCGHFSISPPKEDQTMTDEKFLGLLKQHPELWDEVMKILRGEKGVPTNEKAAE